MISTVYFISRVYIFESFLPLQIEIWYHFFAWICAELLWYENGDRFQIINQPKSYYWNKVTSTKTWHIVGLMVISDRGQYMIMLKDSWTKLLPKTLPRSPCTLDQTFIPLRKKKPDIRLEWHIRLVWTDFWTKNKGLEP